ncbi:MAG: hypothetical protein ABI821_08400 [Pseudomonadota bacterium]
MILVLKQMRRVGLAVVALGAIGLSGTAFAQNTASGTSVVNTATVNYTVNAIAQTPINASATFLVDTVINLNLTGGTTVNVTPGQLNAVTVFTLTNTSNIASAFTLAAANTATGDDFDMNQPPATGTPGYILRVDANGNGTYEPGTDTATTIPTLARNASVVVFVLGDVPATAANTNTSIARLTANARDTAVGNPAWVASVGADVAGTVQIVVRNSTATVDDTYVVSSAALSVAKTSAVISDPFNLVSPNAKAIPGAVMEYTITVNNTGAQPATLNSVSDPVPALTTYLFPGQYTGARDVSIQVGAGAPTFCIAEAGGVDSNIDGCVRTGSTLTVGAPAITTVAASSSVIVKFRVTIN